MYTLRHAHHIARLLLACLCASLGAAVASPILQARHLERVCTASGEVRWVAAGASHAAAGTAQAHLLDCALCLPPMVPATGQTPLPAPPGKPATAEVGLARQAHVPALSRAPFPPRAPPVPHGSLPTSAALPG